MSISFFSKLSEFVLDQGFPSIRYLDAEGAMPAVWFSAVKLVYSCLKRAQPAQSRDFVFGERPAIQDGDAHSTMAKSTQRHLKSSPGLHGFLHDIRCAGAFVS